MFRVLFDFSGGPRGRKARHREIQRAPEECDGLVLPRKRARNMLNTRSACTSWRQKIFADAARSLRDAVGIERNGALDLARHGTRCGDRRRARAARHHRRVEVRCRHRGEGMRCSARGSAQLNLVGAEIEVDLQRAPPIIAPAVSPRLVTNSTMPHQWFDSGARASFTLPTTWVHRCSVLQVSCQSA